MLMAVSGTDNTCDQIRAGLKFDQLKTYLLVGERNLAGNGMD